MTSSATLFIRSTIFPIAALALTASSSTFAQAPNSQSPSIAYEWSASRCESDHEFVSTLELGDEHDLSETCGEEALSYYSRALARAQQLPCPALQLSARSAVGSCLMGLGKHFDSVEQFLEVLDSPRLPDEKRSPIEAHIKEQLSKAALALLRLEPRANADSLAHVTILIDGRTLPRGRRLLVLFPGQHSIRATVPGHKPLDITVDIQPAAVIDEELPVLPIALEFEALEQPNAQGPEQHGNRQGVLKTNAVKQPEMLTWIVGGTSTALAIAGGVLLAISRHDINKVERAKKGTPWIDLEAANRDAPVMSGIGFSLVGVGVAGIATALVLGLSGDDKPREAYHVTIGLGSASLQGKF